MRQLHLQLYGRTDKTDFNEELSARETVTLTPERTTFRLELQPPPTEKFVELRLDPDDKPSEFILHDLRILANDQEIYRWNGRADALPAMIDAQATESHDHVQVETTSNDSFLLMPLSEPQSGALVLELAVSQALSAPELRGDAPAIEALGAHQQELSEAVLSLQGSLRSALDDLASEQEGLQDALVVQHAHARSDGAVLKQEISKITERTDSLEALLKSVTSDLMTVESTLTKQIEATTTEVKGAILTEVRDDWRSLHRQIEARAEQAARDAQRRDAALAARDEEMARLAGTVRRLSQSHESMKRVRAELGALHDEDALSKLQQLNQELRAARSRISELESSLCRRVARFFRG